MTKMSKYLYETAFAIGVISATGSTVATVFAIADIIKIKRSYIPTKVISNKIVFEPRWAEGPLGSGAIRVGAARVVVGFAHNSRI